MVVDDDAAIRESLSDLLKEEGFEVAGARNGRDALNQLKPDESCLIVLDLQMPGMDGWQFLQAMVEAGLSPDRHPVIVMSAAGDLASAGESKGVIAALSKPFQLAKLLAAAAVACDGLPRERKSRVPG